MIQLFYHIYKNKLGRFVYHEFNSGFRNGYAFCCNDAYFDFETYGQAKEYAIKRGGSDAFGY